MTYDNTKSHKNPFFEKPQGAGGDGGEWGGFTTQVLSRQINTLLYQATILISTQNLCNQTKDPNPNRLNHELNQFNQVKSRHAVHLVHLQLPRCITT